MFAQVRRPALPRRTLKSCAADTRRESRRLSQCRGALSVIVLINADHTVVLNSSEDTKALKIVTGGHMNLRELTDALRGIADVSSLQYAWIDCKWLRENSGLL